MATNVALSGSYTLNSFTYDDAYVKIDNIVSYIAYPDDINTTSNVNLTSSDFAATAKVYANFNALQTSSRDFIDDVNFAFTSSASDADNPLYTQAYAALKLIPPFDTFATINHTPG